MTSARAVPGSTQVISGSRQVPRGSRQVLVVLALANLVSYAARNALFAVYPDLVAAYGIDDSQIGFLQTLFMIPHAAATLGFGWAGDRFDRRKVIAAGLLIAGIAGAAGAIATSYLQLAISRAAVGFGTAAIVPVANSILSQIFEGAAKASRLAVFNLGLFLGGVVGFASGMVLGFPVVVIALALPGIALAAMIAMLPVPPRVADMPRARVAGEPDLAALVRAFFADTRVLLRIPTLRWVIVSTTVMAFSAGGYNAWLKEFLVREKGLSDPEATTLLVLALCGGLSGILVGARFSDRLRRRRVAGRLWAIAIGMAITVPVASLAITVPKGLGLDIAGIATLFFFSWYHAPMAATVDDLAPPELAVSAQGLVIFTMHMIGTAPSSWIVGAVSEETSLHAAMWVPTAALVVAAACMMMATRTFAVDHARARGGAPAMPSL